MEKFYSVGEKLKKFNHWYGERVVTYPIIQSEKSLLSILLINIVTLKKILKN